MSIFEKIELPNVKHIIAVASGKGGVGKSTVSANLAIALARQGLNVALVDADIYGPSIPTMFGIEEAKPEVSGNENQELIFPIERYGVKIISVGFFIAKDAGLIWRGPMIASFLTQLYENTQWGEIDYLIIDFPPGTGDIQLTTMQKLKLSGIIMVTTPQDIAVNDARKAASMFTNPDLAIPIMGVIENMSWFTPKKHPEEKYFIFGKGGGETLAKELNVKLLGQLPLVAEVGEAAEKGLSVFNQSDENIISIFEKIVENIL